MFYSIERKLNEEMFKPYIFDVSNNLTSTYLNLFISSELFEYLHYHKFGIYFDTTLIKESILESISYCQEE